MDNRSDSVCIPKSPVMDPCSLRNGPEPLSAHWKWEGIPLCLAFAFHVLGTFAYLLNFFFFKPL